MPVCGPSTQPGAVSVGAEIELKTKGEAKVTLPYLTSKPSVVAEARALTCAIAFEVGKRVKLSALGSQRCPRIARKVGTVTGLIPNSQTIAVRFDGNKRSTSIHRDYVELLKSDHERVRTGHFGRASAGRKVAGNE